MRLRLALTAIGLMLLVASPADAKTFVVTKRGDPAPDACKSGDCSLREAVRAAHERAGADVIELRNGRKPYNLRLGGVDEDLGLVGDLDILNDPLVIKHPGKGRATIVGNGVDRVFDVLPGAPTTFRKLVIRGGDSHSSGDGGAIRSQADVKVIRSTLAGNEAAPDFDGCGGGLSAVGGRIVIVRSRIVRNEAGDCGGGLAVGTAAPGSRIVKSTIAANRVSGSGGGGFISSSEAPLRITATTISGNRANFGGGFDLRGDLVLTNSTVASNGARFDGGGIHFAAVGPVVGLNAVTVARNVADSDGDGSGGGGGIYRDSFGAGRTQASLRGTADVLAVENTLLGRNRLGSGERNDCDGITSIQSLGHNLVSTLGPPTMGSPTTCDGFDRRSDLVGINPRIGKLKRNGGPTQTIALRKRSPALNKAKRSTAPNRDQRGQRRGRKKDIGAYERNVDR